MPVLKPDGVAGVGLWDTKLPHQRWYEVTKLLCRGMVLERPAVVGNSPVLETYAAFVVYPK